MYGYSQTTETWTYENQVLLRDYGQNSVKEFGEYLPQELVYVYIYIYRYYWVTIDFSEFLLNQIIPRTWTAENLNAITLCPQKIRFFGNLENA